jgi:hypothetical protein
MPVDIKGKTYWTVAERLTLAQGEDFVKPVGIKSITSTVEGAGNMVVMRAEVAFSDGRVFSGHSLVNLNASGPAERDAPLETAETSALGRALAFAGYYGSPEGIAGAEEIALAQARSEARASRTTVSRYADGDSPVTRMPSSGSGGAAPRPVQREGGGGGGDYAVSPAQARYLTRLWEQANRPFPPPDTATMERREVSTLIDELKAELNIT